MNESDVAQSRDMVLGLLKPIEASGGLRAPRRRSRIQDVASKTVETLAVKGAGLGPFKAKSRSSAVHSFGAS